MNPIVSFMMTPAGRIGRIAAGVALIAGGLLAVGGTGGYVIAALGLVPLAAGSLDLCLMAPIFRVPLAGRKVRAMR